MRRLISIWLILLTAFTAAAKKNNIPDFAFPKQVVKQSESQLKSALKSADGPATLRALINLTVAEDAIDTQRVNAALQQIRETRAAVKDSVTASMIDVLEARLLFEVYNSNSYAFDRRLTPELPLPADVAEWNGKQFRSRIDALLTRALANSVALSKVEIAKWASVITLPEYSELYYPSLLDFTGLMGLEMYNSSSALSNPRLEVCNLLINANANHPAALILNEIKRLRTLSGSHNSELLNLFNRWSDRSEFAAEALIALYDDGYVHFDSPAPKVADFLAKIKFIQKKYPSGIRNDNLKQIAASLTRKQLVVDVPQCFAPGKITVKVTARNVANGSIDVYKVKPVPNGTLEFRPTFSPGELVGQLAVSLCDTVPSFGELRLDFNIAKEGCYIFVPVTDIEKAQAKEYLPISYCTRLALTASDGQEPAVWALNGVDGAPLKGISINQSAKDQYFGPQIGITDNAGFLKLPDSWKQGRVYASQGQSLTPAMWVGVAQKPENEPILSARIFTALPLYHPGDSVRWSAVAYSSSPASRSLLSNRKLEATLYDANHQKVESTTLVTDKYGRVAGSFAIPEGGLQGNFTISLKGDKLNASQWFMVSDYELPTFEIETFPAATQNDKVRLMVTARTYSGFSLDNAKVSLKVTPASFWRWQQADEEPVFSSEQNLAAGSYTFEVARSLLSDKQLYRATFIVTSASGESHQAERMFSIRPLFTITGSEVSAIDISEKSFQPRVQVLDSDLSPVESKVDYAITRGDSLMLKGSFSTTKPEISLAGLTPGEATLKMYPARESADSLIYNNVVLYDSNSSECPVDEVLWTPSPSTINLDASRRCRILVAAHSDTHILLTISRSGQVLSQRWIEFPAGQRFIEVEMPAKVDKANLSLGAVANYVPKQFTFTLVAPEARQQLIVKAESMRNRVVPGAQEEWTFSVTDADGKPVTAPMILDMYNRSLDALASSSWSFRPLTSYEPQWNWRAASNGYPNTSSTLTGTPYFKLSVIEAPSFETYGRALYLYPRIYGYATPSKAMSNVMIRGSKMAAVETVAEDAEADGGIEEALPDAVSASGVSEATAEQTSPEFSYRDSEVPLAFFEPMLVAENGKLNLKFTVPNANTTWGLNALAFNNQLLSSLFTSDVVASKPVMVQPNLPRFLRQGDRMEIAALVMNNSGQKQSITTVVEIYNPASGKMIDTITQTSDLAPSASDKVVITVDAPENMSMLGYRIKSSSSTFADGEQALIPILQAFQPVVKAYPFYIPQGDKLFTMQLPKLADGARVSLEYCENPAWYVVTALPGLRESEPLTALQAASGLFSAAVADGIVRSNPTIAKALHQWTMSNRSDSTLVSMLSKNQDLKIALLQATPWMMDARSDTERMERLALLFDRKTVDKALSDGLNVLAKLQRNGGGWAWIEAQDEADEWATFAVMEMLGQLNELGYLPKDSRLNSMISNALGFMDRKVAEDFKKNPNGNFTRYVYIRDAFPDVRQSSAAARVSSAMVQQLIGRWSYLDVPAKAVAAVILYNHNYAATARQILESIREYAVTTPEGGMSWPSIEAGWWSRSEAALTGYVLRAFATVEPGCADIDLIRQWLVLQKGAQDWGTSVDTSLLVATFLSSSPKWMQSAQGVEIAVGKSRVDATPIDRTLGYVRADISSMSPSEASLSIAGPAATPSWGAVFSQSTERFADIEAHSVPDLKIERSLAALASDGSVKEIRGKSAVGTKVRVNLTLNVGRTMDYVTIEAPRGACMEPVEQLPGMVWAEGVAFYRQSTSTATSFFLTRLPKGVYVLSYDVWVNAAGVYTMAPVTIQSQYNPALVANTSAIMLEVR